MNGGLYLPTLCFVSCNCDEYCMKIGARFVTDSILQLRLDPHELDLHCCFANTTFVAWEYGA